MIKAVTSLKYLWIGGAISVLLAGCVNSEKSMEGMDHSKMNQAMNTEEPRQTGPSAENKTINSETLAAKEITLTAKASNLEVLPGKIIPVWTYNNSVPGPQIRVKQGDVLKVNLKNELSAPVTIHWHGVPVPNNMDGIPGVTQNAVQPGQTFTYEFKAEVPGTYWYHSHQDSVNQVDKGLYGSLIVEPKNEEKPDRDYTLVLDEWMSSGTSGMDMSGMDMSGMDHSKMNMDASNHASTANSQSSAAAGHDMSMYDLYTINGKSGSSIDKLTVKKGDKVRIRLINAGYKSHNMHLHGQEFKVTATDGQPIQNPPLIKDQLIAVAPGERYDLEFEAVNPGVWYLEEHGKEAPVKNMKALIQYEGSSDSKDRADDDKDLPVLDITKYGKAAKAKFTLDQKYNLDYTMDLGTNEHQGNPVYTINNKAYPNTDAIQVNTGDLVKVRLTNTSKSDDHPMHLHGHFFQILSKDGKPLEGSPIIKDTLNVKPGEEYVVAFEADNPGNWMFHCHDLHHAAAGMVTSVNYLDYKTDFVPDPKAGNMPE